ncbi:MAG: aldo/keto reductase [Actinomycetota bacterium]|nr:aldo/keto reductase [Actinomycetota bacterium]
MSEEKLISRRRFAALLAAGAASALLAASGCARVDETAPTRPQPATDADADDAPSEKGPFMIPDITLNSGHSMPVVGLGTWTLTNAQAETSTYAALSCGMRLIDTARYYANEVGVGRGIRRAMDDGLVTRDEVFVTSKIYGGDYARAGGIIDDALADLGLDHIDLLLIHQPGSDDAGVWRAMEEAHAAGKLRSIGISNYYTPTQVDAVLSFATTPPAVIQNENHVYYQNAQLETYATERGIALESWYPFCGRGHTQDAFGNETVAAIAGAHGKTPAQAIVRWQAQTGRVVIPGSSNPDHIRENFSVFDFELTADEMAQMAALDERRRYESW